MSDYKKYYSQFLKKHEGQLHLSSHSHYFWPDISFSAYEDYWDLAARKSDQKWEQIFSKHIPKAQSLISKILNIDSPQRIAFAPNTQELTARLISCFYDQNEMNFLTTKSEFHSFSRQVSRLEEQKHVHVKYIDNEQEAFEENFLKSITPNLTMIFLSQVFYNSGKLISKGFIQKIIAKKSKDTVLVIDGYHGFCAVKTDLSDIVENIYYLAGAYKYAQAGEGMCFMTTPKECKLRPLNTGWFAAFSDLENKSSDVTYDNSGLRFASSTLDFSTLFKFNKIWSEFEKENISYIDIIEHSKALQKLFFNLVDKSYLTSKELEKIGLFLCYDFKDIGTAQEIFENLKHENILTDRRDSRIRFSFAAYISQEEVKRASELFNKLIIKFCK